MDSIALNTLRSEIKSDQQIDSLRELCCSYMDQIDAEISPVIERLAQLIAQLPDDASQAPDKADYIIRLLEKVETIVRETDPLPAYVNTLLKVRSAIGHHIITGQDWRRDL